MDPYTNSTLVDVIITQSHSWFLARFPCDQNTIDTLGYYNDGPGAFSGQPFVACRPNATFCTGTGYVTIQQLTYCTDFSLAVQISSGSLIKRVTLNRNTNIVVGFYGGNWASEILNASSLPALGWEVDIHIDLTQKYPINSSPGRTLVPSPYQ